MPPQVRVLQLGERPQTGWYVVNTTSRASTEWERSLSPFYLGPVTLYGGFTSHNLENAWQHTKVYKQHTDSAGEPTDAYWEWATAGWLNPRAVRYPMGKGAKPEYSLWDGLKLDYVSARKQIYIPLYAEAVYTSAGFGVLRKLYKELSKNETIALQDFDGYDHVRMNLTLTEVVNNPQRKCGHAFVIAMLLTDDPVMDTLFN
jgi:hypothetical protein